MHHRHTLDPRPPAGPVPTSVPVQAHPPARGARRFGRVEPKASAALWAVGFLWVLTLFDPQWYLAAIGPAGVTRISTLMYALLALILLVGTPMTSAWRARWQWYAPLLVFVLLGAISIPFAVDNGRVRLELRQHLSYWLLLVASAAIVHRARIADKLIMLLGLHYVWWGIWGLRGGGLVFWHTFALANADAYGSLMVSGVGVCYFLAGGTDKRWWRWAMVTGFVLSTAGVVASFARGAFFAMVVLFGMVVLRSTHKLRTLGAGVAFGVVMMGAVAVFYPDTFWAEMQTAFTQGTTEGTGEDRWELWKAAWQVFLEHPVIGVGANNFGAFAASFFQLGDVGGQYALNIGRLYGMNPHNEYMRFLSERGLLGVCAFLWIVIDFFRRNAALRSPTAIARWRADGGRWDLRAVSLALESSMIAWLITAMLYPVSQAAWLFMVLALNVLLHSLVVRAPTERTTGRGQRFSRASRRGVPLPAD